MRRYDWDPATLLAGVPESAIVGVEAPIWSETLATIRDVEYLAFPRLAAVAEIGWSPADRRRWAEFSERLGAQSSAMVRARAQFLSVSGCAVAVRLPVPCQPSVN